MIRPPPRSPLFPYTTLSRSKDAFDLFGACFPAGTLTGAPKVRAMEIIDQLEPVRRGFYGGTVGYFSKSGQMDQAIDRKSTRLNSSHLVISYAGFCLKKKKWKPATTGDPLTDCSRSGTLPGTRPWTRRSKKFEPSSSRSSMSCVTARYAQHTSLRLCE